MLIAETRPSRSCGVTVCRNVVVPMTHRIGPAPRVPVGEQTGGNGEEHERQCQSGLQQPGFRHTGTQRQHRDDGCGGQGDLLSRLGREIGPG